MIVRQFNDAVFIAVAVVLRQNVVAYNVRFRNVKSGARRSHYPVVGNTANADRNSNSSVRMSSQVTFLVDGCNVRFVSTPLEVVFIKIDIPGFRRDLNINYFVGINVRRVDIANGIEFEVYTKEVTFKRFDVSVTFDNDLIGRRLNVSVALGVGYRNMDGNFSVPIRTVGEQRSTLFTEKTEVLGHAVPVVILVTLVGIPCCNSFELFIRDGDIALTNAYRVDNALFIYLRNRLVAGSPYQTVRPLIGGFHNGNDFVSLILIKSDVSVFVLDGKVGNIARQSYPVITFVHGVVGNHDEETVVFVNFIDILGNVDFNRRGSASVLGSYGSGATDRIDLIFAFGDISHHYALCIMIVVYRHVRIVSGLFRIISVFFNSVSDVGDDRRFVVASKLKRVRTIGDLITVLVVDCTG